MNSIFLILIRFYRRYISPLKPKTCRFEPTCSAYGMQAYQRYPFFKATYLTLWRIMRCNPFNPGGSDPLK